jgi:hypothetical protein
MKAIVRAAIATAITGVLIYVFISYTQNRADQAIAEGWDLSRAFRVQIILAFLIRRSWWFFTAFFGLSYWLIFHLLDDDRA